MASLGQQSLDSHQVTIINGVMSRVDHHGREFRYRLTPRKSGELVIPPPQVTVGGKALRGETLNLVVLPPSAQDLAAVELTADHKAVYPTQPFTVTLSVFVKRCRRRFPARSAVGAVAAARLRIPGSRTCRPGSRPRKTGSNGSKDMLTRTA